MIEVRIDRQHLQVKPGLVSHRYYRLSEELVDWLYENVGMGMCEYFDSDAHTLSPFQRITDSGWRSGLYWYWPSRCLDQSIHIYGISFRNKSDAVLFKLTWGGQ